MALPIEDYALIGDRHTAALVGKDGSIDWLCLPRFDSPSCFSALLGTPDHGRWLLAPTGEFQVSRRYLDGSTVLETTCTTASGQVTIVDLMPTGDQRADVVRQVTCVSGTVAMEHEWVVRPGYGVSRPWVRRVTVDGDEVITAISGPDQLILRGSRLPKADDGRHRDEFEMSEGDVLTFSTTWVPSYADPPGRDALEKQIRATIHDDREWLEMASLDGVPHADLVRRSLLTLRLLTHEDTGGIVAAPTTSLPEDFGGERNWDYRFCWLRDAALTLGALLDAGYTDEARWWRRWLLRAVAGDAEHVQIMYTVDAARYLPERTLDHLPGYADSRPVRVGNAAVDQVQSDVFGEVMIALERAREAGVETSEWAWALQRKLVEGLARRWRDPDHGLWEIRGEPQKFTHSRVMIWAAFDSAVRAMEDHGLAGPLAEWRDLREKVRDEVLELGFNRERNTFTQHYDTTDVDASLLVLPLVGFIAGDDPRVLGTIEAIEKDLLRDGLVLRYRTESGVDGLAGDEHPFLACSFWLVSAYVLAGRRDDAAALFDRLCGLTNDVGLLSEEYDPTRDRMVGNFPQAFSHLALVQAACLLGDPQESADPEDKQKQKDKDGRGPLQRGLRWLRA
jgi:GH15 family glucan-1,4-alpha-glucosidase